MCIFNFTYRLYTKDPSCKFKSCHIFRDDRISVIFETTSIEFKNLAQNYIIELDSSEESIMWQSTKLMDSSNNDQFQSFLDKISESWSTSIIRFKPYTKLVIPMKASKLPFQFSLIHNASPLYWIEHTHFSTFTLKELKKQKLAEFVQTIIGKKFKIWLKDIKLYSIDESRAEISQS